MICIKNCAKIIPAVCLCFCFACETENPTELETPPVNFFSMSVNRGEWIPRQRSTTCEDVFYSLPGAFIGPEGYRPFYDIVAFGQTNGHDAHFEVQVTNVVKTGVYLLDKTYREYHNYATLLVYEGSQRKKYVSQIKRVPFTFTVDKFLAKRSPVFQGIEGTFGGVLYNEENPLDSLLIDRGIYRFETDNKAKCYY